MSLPIVAIPLAMKLPTRVAHTPSQPTVPKPKKKRVICNPAIKKPRTALIIKIFDLTDEVKRLVFASLIVE